MMMDPSFATVLLWVGGTTVVILSFYFFMRATARELSEKRLPPRKHGRDARGRLA
jgi:hypothetical protein